MIRRRELATYVLAVLLSAIGHFLLIGGLSSAARGAMQQRGQVLEFAVFESKPPPPAEPKPTPKPPAPDPVDLTKVEIPIEETPPPPPSNTDAGELEPEEAPPVFGVSMSSVVGPGTGSGFRVRVGNTLMKAPEEEFTAPEDVKTYKPVPLHKVSKMARFKRGACPTPYPPRAKEAGIQGRVVLEVEVLPDGTVGNVTVVKGLGFGLDEAAVAAIKSCPFEPAEIAGRAVMTIVTVPYTFVIDA